MSAGQTLRTQDQAEGEAPRVKDVKFTLYSASEFPKLPTIHWLIEDVLPASGLGCIYGPPGVGKSFLCIDMVAAIARCKKWFGHATHVCNDVVYVALEGQAGFRARIPAYEKDHGIKFPEDVKFVFDNFDITDLENPLSLGYLIKEGGGADLIIIDTLSRASLGGDENSSTHVGKIIEGAQALQILTGAMVLFVHHPGKDSTRGIRGHSMLLGALDTAIEVYKDGENIRWKLTKSKDSEDGISHCFKLKTVDIGDSNYFAKSCVIQEVEGAAEAKEEIGPHGANQKFILEAARKLLLEHRIQSYLENNGWPDGFPVGMPYEEVLSRTKGALHFIGPKHQMLRAKEALGALVRQGYLVETGDLIGLPRN